jgi:hypothetical protein
MSVEGFSALPEENTDSILGSNPDIRLSELSKQYNDLADTDTAREESEVVSWVQEWPIDSGENSELLQIVDEVLPDFEGLEDSEWNIIDGYDVFSTYIRTASPEIQESFTDFDQGGIVYDTIVDTGKFPVNDFEFQAILAGEIQSDTIKEEDLRWTELAEVREEVAETVIVKNLDGTELGQETIAADIDGIEIADMREEVADKIRIASLERANKYKWDILDFYDWVSGFNVSPELREILSKIDSLDISPEEGIVDQNHADEINSVFDSLTTHLNTSREIEQVILPQARASWNYDAVMETLTTGAFNFESRIAAWEMMDDSGETIETVPLEQQVRTSAALGTDIDWVSEDAEQSGNIFTVEWVDGTEINYDVVTNERSISRNGYSIESQVEDTGDYQTPKLAYMRVEQETLPKMKVIKAITKSIQDKNLSTDDLAEILATIAKVPWSDSLGIDFTSMEGADIKTKLEELFSENKNKVEEAREEYVGALEQLRKDHVWVLATRDERVKRTLSLLDSVGITQMPQYIFTQVTEVINNNPAAYWFQKEINLEEWILWFDGVWENINMDRVKFAEMVNVMLWVEPEHEIAVNPQGVNGIGNTAISNRNDFNEYVTNTSGWQSIGAANTILQRLKNHNAK